MPTTKLLHISKKTIKKAWEEIMKIYTKDFEVELKSDNSPLTIADKTANKIIIEELSKTNIPILSEETKDNYDRLQSKYLWIIDPVDWTKDFINKTWEFSIMIWLVENWRPILGVVNVPSKNKLYFAEKNKWSYLEKNWKIKKLKINKENNKILVSRNHATEIELNLIKKLWLDSKLCWSIWVKFWLIAEWNAWNYLNMYPNFKEWDTCAPEIILSEAGGKVTDIKWNKLIYNKKENYHSWCIWTNNTNHKKILYFINNI